MRANSGERSVINKVQGHPFMPTGGIGDGSVAAGVMHWFLSHAEKEFSMQTQE